ncbi:uncharacterized protein N7496_009234 [Penicillium cataractarum]|uniref:Zn(2)-C6 fungal-type domain-containing protein n=1 Tax=Penicillium cataractarum TaxID=2100454 RepID=A0A9W9V293_9EURO|nr:uncharacterized protein N7496_009234 [Penicillium cataractarum]KAJ5363521.1 hypothetical protein N7496_009234 [Penicillium cataractarum]
MNASTPAVKRRACVACTAVKAKCTPQADNMCQRCARLGKSCTYLDLPQTKRRHKASPSRVDVLENKVGQLMSQLAALTRQNRQTPLVASNPLPDDLGSSRTTELDFSDIPALLDAAEDPSHGIYPQTSSVLAGQPSIVDRGLLSEAEAERSLMTFQLDLVYKFPFVLIARSETAASLRAREPFLFLSVVAATTGSSHPLCKVVADEIMNHVTQRLVAHSERNLELLRGLLVHCAWYSYPAERHHPRLLLLIQFCVSILYDLGLHRKPSLNADEQRALLGTYWLSASLCSILGRPSVMKHDARTDECIKSIASTEHHSDRWIAPFIHLQIFLATMDDIYASIQPSGGSALVQVTRGALQRQFDIVRARVENDLSECPSSIVNIIHMEIKYVEIRLEELCLREELWITKPVSTVRTTMLMGVIQRSKELIRAISNLPASEIAQMTITTCARICAAVGYMPTAIMAILKLITSTTDPSMEAQVRAVVDAAEYPSLITELANALETKFGGMSAADKEADILGSICSKMRLLARCYPHQIRAVVGVAPSQDVRQDTSMMEVQANEIAMTPSVWPSIYGDLGETFPIDDLQWDSLLSNFTGFS